MAKNNRKRRRKKSSFSFFLFIVFCVGSVYLFSNFLFAAPSEPVETAQEVSREEFITHLAPHAKEIHEKQGILASIILGQAILESDWGQSELSQKYNNLFGIKAYGKGDKVYLKTKEYVDGKWIEISADFKVYPDWEASMDDHTALFLNGVSWNHEIYYPVVEATTYKEAAKALQTSGYATDPDYGKKIINVIESYELYQYDQ